MKKKNLKIWLALILLLILFVFKVMIDSKMEIENKKFVINPGDNFLSIANNLKQEGVIRDKGLFVLFAYFNGDYAQIKPGTYLFDGKYTIENIVSVLKDNHGVLVVIPEGLNIYQIENKLIESDVLINKFDLVNYTVDRLSDRIYEYPFLKNVDQKNNLEGFLYPDTYYFVEGMDIDEVVKVFLDNFNKEMYLKFKGDIDGNIYDKLILASLIEKEIYHKKDIPNAVSVIRNRMNNNMLFQIDATLCYIKIMNEYLNNGDPVCKELTNNDKKLESLYNTYMYKEIIPGPICNVGYETFSLVLNNIDTDYLYYITKPDSKDAVFAKTLDEHNLNISKYLK